jgi:hypothetical protein
MNGDTGVPNRGLENEDFGEVEKWKSEEREE